MRKEGGEMSMPRFFVVQVWTSAECAASFRASARAVEETDSQAFSTADELCRFLAAAARSRENDAISTARAAEGERR
jgi:hypothetical protein